VLTDNAVDAFKWNKFIVKDKQFGYKVDPINKNPKCISDSRINNNEYKYDETEALKKFDK